MLVAVHRLTFARDYNWLMLGPRFFLFCAKHTGHPPTNMNQFLVTLAGIMYWSDIWKMILRTCLVVSIWRFLVWITFEFFNMLFTKWNSKIPRGLPSIQNAGFLGILHNWSSIWNVSFVNSFYSNRTWNSIETHLRKTLSTLDISGYTPWQIFYKKNICQLHARFAWNKTL